MEQTSTVFQTILHNVCSVLLYPVLVLLLAAIAFALFELGSVLVELVRERRFFQVEMPKLLHSIQDTPLENMTQAIAASGLLRKQQLLLMTLFRNRDLDEESRWALAKKLLLEERDRTSARVQRDDSLAKVAPMLGLMGTLIPLGPGIVAFGNGDPSAMSGAMLVAFDTTVAGLVASAVLFLVARVRKRWYGQYNSTLEAGVTALLERMDKMSDSERSVRRGPLASGAGKEDA